MLSNDQEKFEKFVQPLLERPVSHVWRGYGSAIFVEFGKLSDRVRANGTKGNNPVGEWTLMVEWSWRLEGKRRIWCGSWSDEEKWLSNLCRLMDTRVSDISLLGRLPEISVSFSNGLHLLSFMTAEGDPSWDLTRRDGDVASSIDVIAGRLRFQESAASIRVDRK